MSDYYIIGLGNPGDKYVGTRHNVGKDVVNKFISSTEKNNFRIIYNNNYMNISGKSVLDLVKEMDTDIISRIIVVSDDVDIPFGSFVISFGKGSGGHNGVNSIINAIGTNKFIRIRIGITPNIFGVIHKPNKDVISRFVLKKFSILEKKKLDIITNSVILAMDDILEYGIDFAMNKYNNKDSS